VDSCVYTGYKILPFYDSMIAKLIVFGRDRPEAVARLSRALDEFISDGPPTTIKLGQALLKDQQFLDGKYHTGYLEHFMKDRF
jgi:acetyl-CoA carboxylase biotin carboxylase subunit